MKSMESRASCCGRCNYYTPEGRRGGHCAQLGVTVKSRWKACSLAVPVFLTPLPQLEPSLPQLRSVERLAQAVEIHLPVPITSEFSPLEPSIFEERLEEKKTLTVSH